MANIIKLVWWWRKWREGGASKEKKEKNVYVLKFNAKDNS